MRTALCTPQAQGESTICIYRSATDSADITIYKIIQKKNKKIESATNLAAVIDLAFVNK